MGYAHELLQKTQKVLEVLPNEDPINPTLTFRMTKVMEETLQGAIDNSNPHIDDIPSDIINFHVASSIASKFTQEERVLGLLQVNVYLQGLENLSRHLDSSIVA